MNVRESSKISGEIVRKRQARIQSRCVALLLLPSRPRIVPSPHPARGAQRRGPTSPHGGEVKKPHCFFPILLGCSNPPPGAQRTAPRADLSTWWGGEKPPCFFPILMGCSNPR